MKQVRESSELYSAYALAVLERYVRQSVMPYIRALEPEYRSGGRAKGELVVASEVITYFTDLATKFVLDRTEEDEFAQLDKRCQWRWDTRWGSAGRMRRSRQRKERRGRRRAE